MDIMTWRDALEELSPCHECSVGESYDMYCIPSECRCSIAYDIVEHHLAYLESFKATVEGDGDETVD